MPRPVADYSRAYLQRFAQLPPAERRGVIAALTALDTALASGVIVQHEEQLPLEAEDGPLRIVQE